MNRIVAGALLSIGLVTATASYAVDSPPKHRGHHHHAQSGATLPSERVEARLAYLKTALKITDRQQAQWDAFANAERQQAAARDVRVREWRAQAHEPGKRPKRTAIVQLETQQSRLAAAAAGLNDRLAVIRPLYAALSDEQKQVADEVLVFRGRGHFHHPGARGRA